MAEYKSEKILISFMCQRCSQPIKLDDSLSSFSEHISAELNLPIHSNPDVDLESQATSFDQYIPACRLVDSGNGFMLISDENEVDSLSHAYKKKAALFDTLSGNSNIDHPLCDECTDYLLEILEQELIDTQTDYDDYLRYYKMLQNDTNEPKLSELEKELEDLKAEGNRFLEELEALKKEEIELQNAIKEQEAEARRLDKERNIYYKEYTKHQKNYTQACEDAKSLECQLNYTQIQLDKLKKTNVFNATFHIWHKGHFGTINNFCLGRLPSAPVDWSEINAAWGQTALLLSALARKINLTFERYRLVPYGNHSYIEVIGEQKEFPLYGSGGFKFLWDTKFDNGMAAFLDCLQQFQEKVEKLEKGNKQFCFPYRTNKGKIEDNDASYSIKIQLNSEEQWTKAMKFMLTNLKWGLAWISSQLNNDIEENMQTEN
ncbi:Beclin-1-like protein [Tribolium castaneum]|uniref:Beclin-1-like protein n=1 Tax=Tribolium castaneum TaxID=7070 RepID=D6WPT7_TRICA|nr:PREDICTED: beclin-1-like protein [Tribolium castaneum]EFA06871.2 Beclin-1-like protein [Tribolium castaneum]|eukprot:XP_008195616.1 PREDICTED: beclin-1-like protein [Tribolium castaneum]